MSPLPEFVVITGLSGSGRSTAVKAFEDMGSYCVDNLPTALLPKMLDLVAESTMDLKIVALGMDIREKDFLRDFPNLFNEIRGRGVPIRLLFLTASEKVLVRRYSETRRVHPLGGHGPLLDTIREEAREMEPLKKIADQIVDTSEMTLRDLKEEVMKICRERMVPEKLNVTVLTFGFKHGLPFNADLVFDVRFLPNPFFVQELKQLTGLDAPVRDFVLSKPETEAFFREYYRFLSFLIPRYLEEGRAYVTIGIGCTGGKHRSVVVARSTAEFLEGLGCTVTVRNRDIGES